MLAQSTSTLTEGARRTKRSRFATIKAVMISAAVRKNAGGTRSGRKWLIHLPATAGIASTSAMTRTRLRSATANTPESSTSESKSDTTRSPPLISSTKGAATKKRPRAMRSCTAENRRNFRRSGIVFIDPVLDTASFIWFHKVRDSDRQRLFKVHLTNPGPSSSRAHPPQKCCSHAPVGRLLGLEQHFPHSAQRRGYSTANL